MSQVENLYDAVAYESTAIPECTPLRMSLIAEINGLPSVPPEQASLLDIGCGDATNIIALAANHPGLQVTGIDPSGEAIRRGEALAADAGLDNVTLLHGGAADFDHTDAYDYVIAHGVMTWVDDEVRAAVLRLAARSVRPGGFVLLSYNALPTGYLRAMGRDVVRAAIADAEAENPDISVEDKVAAGIERLELAAQLGSDRGHGALMAFEAKRLKNRQPWLVLHDELSDPWTPFRVTTMAEIAGAEGLEYVGELRPNDHWAKRLDVQLVTQIESVAQPTALARQQLVDDLAGAAFHSSLFVRADKVPPQPDTVDVPLYAVGLDSGKDHDDQVSRVVQAALPNAISSKEIAKQVNLPETTVRDILLKLDATGRLEVSVYPPPAPSTLADKPKTSPIVVAQLRAGLTRLVTRNHRSANLDDATILRVFLLLMDGTRDRAALVEELPAAAAAEGETQEAIDALLETIDQYLEMFTTIGLFEPAGTEAG